MPFVSPTFASLVDGITSLVTQKAAAFRPGGAQPGEIYTVVCDRDAGDIVHRYFYRCLNNATFELLGEPAGDWQPQSSDSSPQRSSVSFVIDPNGQYIHAVTTVDYLVGGGIYNHVLYYGLLDLDDIQSGWTDTVLDEYSNTETTGYINPDIIIDHRPTGDKKPIIVSKKVGATENTVWTFWYGADPGTLNIVQIDGDQTPNGLVSIVDDPNSDYFYVHAGLNLTAYLYRLLFDENGIAQIPELNSWTDPFESELPDANVQTGSGDVGILQSSAGVRFRMFQNDSMTDIETVEAATTAVNSNGLCFRGGQWHAVLSTVPSGNDSLHWFLRSSGGSWEEQDMGGGQPGSSVWLYFGITGFENNPVPRGAYEFGCLIVEYGSPTSNAKYFHIDQWEPYLPPPPTNNHWDKGELLGGTLFDFDLDTNAPAKVSGNVNLKIMDIVEVEDAIIHTDQNEFFEWKQDFYKEWRDDDTYDNVSLIITFPAYPRDNDFLKLCQGILVEWVATGDNSIYVTVTNEKNQFKPILLTNDDNGKPINFSFGGRYFKSMVMELSADRLSLRKFAIWGQTLGSVV